MCLVESNAEQLLNDGTQPDAIKSEQARCEFGVKESLGNQTQCLEAGKILACGVQDPLFTAKSIGERLEGIESGRIEEECACTLTMYLNKVRLLPVAEPGRAFRINTGGTCTSRDPLGRLFKCGQICDERPVCGEV